MEVLREQRTKAELTQRHLVHPSQVVAWKRRAHQVVLDAFAARRRQRQADLAISVLLAKIGELQIHIDALGGGASYCSRPEVQEGGDELARAAAEIQPAAQGRHRQADAEGNQRSKAVERAQHQAWGAVPLAQ